MTAPPALLFDLDGCLVDSLPVIRRCWELTLPRFGASPPDERIVRGLAGPPLGEAARRLLPEADDATIDAVIGAYRRCALAHAGEVELFGGVRALLETVAQRGVRLAVATSKTIDVAEAMLAALGLRDRFAAVEGTPVDELGTDKATVVGRAISALGGAPPLALVGDRAHDVVGAHAHGLRCIGALWGYGGREELRRAGADALAQTPEDVLGLV